MNTIIMKAMLVGIIMLTLCSCHEDEKYYCYLVEYKWPNDGDTLAVYNEALWFYNRTSKPQDECKVDRADLIIENQWSASYSCICDCGWE